jgi:hypothetical protein
MSLSSSQRSRKLLCHSLSAMTLLRHFPMIYINCILLFSRTADLVILILLYQFCTGMAILCIIMHKQNWMTVDNSHARKIKDEITDLIAVKGTCQKWQLRPYQRDGECEKWCNRSSSGPHGKVAQIEPKYIAGCSNTRERRLRSLLMYIIGNKSSYEHQRPSRGPRRNTSFEFHAPQSNSRGGREVSVCISSLDGRDRIISTSKCTLHFDGRFQL